MKVIVVILNLFQDPTNITQGQMRKAAVPVGELKNNDQKNQEREP